MTGPQRSPISHECCLRLSGLKSSQVFVPNVNWLVLVCSREDWKSDVCTVLRKCHDFYPNASHGWYMLWIALEPPGWGCQTINKQTNESV